MKRYLVLWAVVGVVAPMFPAPAGTFKGKVELSESVSSGETISGDEIRLELDPKAFEGSDFVEVVVQCGDDAMRISKGENAPFLETVFD